MTITTTRPAAGGILAATQALRGPQQTFDREQVAYLMRLAYLSGRVERRLDDLAELHGIWAEHRDPRLTREDRVQARMAEMDRVARLAALRRDEPYREHPGGPVDWETGRPTRYHTARSDA